MDIVSYVLGKNSGGGGSSVIVSKSITENGIYAASEDSADGYSPVTVNVPSGGGVDIEDYFITTRSTRLAPTKSVILESITHLPTVDYTGITNMGTMFLDCGSLKSVPLFDTASVTYMNGMFNGCGLLENVPPFDTSSVVSMSSMFYECGYLKTVPQLNAQNVIFVGSAFYNCRSMVTFGGFLNLGQGYLTTQAANYSQYTLKLSYSTLLTHDSLMNVINGLYDIATKGCNAQGLVLGSTNLAKLTATEIAIATTKGWTVS